MYERSTRPRRLQSMSCWKTGKQARITALSSGPYSKNWNIWENRGTTRSRHKTANCADNITLLATCGRGVRIATRGSQNMNEFYLSSAALALPGQRPRARRRPWAARCLLSLMVAAGAGRANAAPLEEGAEGYRAQVV